MHLALLYAQKSLFHALLVSVLTDIPNLELIVLYMCFELSNAVRLRKRAMIELRQYLRDGELSKHLSFEPLVIVRDVACDALNGLALLQLG